MGLYTRQLNALLCKDLLLFRRNAILNLVRCLVLPVLYILFVAEAQRFFNTVGQYGVGRTPRPIKTIAETLGNLNFIWIDQSGNATLASRLAADITSGLPRRQVIQLANQTALAQQCPENYNQVSGCYGAVVFTTLDSSTNTYNYILRLDNGLLDTNVQDGTSSHEMRHFPLQWAVDQAIFRQTFGNDGVPPTPVEIPFTQITNSERATNLRRSFVRGTRAITALAFFVGQVGVIYQLIGGIATEREESITQLLDVMGCSRSARLLSWHLSYSAFYFLGWLFSGIIISRLVFTLTNAAIVIIFHILFGLAIVSWSIWIATFFKRAQLSGISGAIGATVLAIVAMVVKDKVGNTGAVFVSAVFPPMTYVFGLIILANFERDLIPLKMLGTGGQHNGNMLAFFVVMFLQIFAYFALAWWTEQAMYGTRSLFRKRGHKKLIVDDRYSLELRTISKRFASGLFKKKAPFYAVKDLSLKVTKGEIFCLLGSNGSGKSTTLGMIAGTLAVSDGEILVNGLSRLDADFPPGLVSLCPQKNVLWDDLTVLEHIRLWSRIKSVADNAEDLVSLLERCDLGTKVSARSHTLSGGMKRKLQLAIAFCGESKVCLIDEVSSGIDPLARRKLHDIILENRGIRTQILTTHFLDEADLLADRIALMSKGVLKAEGTPVALKVQLGSGYILNVLRPNSDLMITDPIYNTLATMLPEVTRKVVSHEETEYRLPTTDVNVIRRVLAVLERDKTRLEFTSYDIGGPRLEDVFLRIMEAEELADASSEGHAYQPDVRSEVSSTVEKEKGSVIPIDLSNPAAKDTFSNISLTSGRQTTQWEQTSSQFRKRLTIARHNPWPTLASIILGVAAVTISLVFIKNYRATCGISSVGRRRIPLQFPIPGDLALPQQPFLIGPSPAVLLRPYRGILPSITPITVDSVQQLRDNLTQFNTQLATGGFFVDFNTAQATFSWLVLAGSYGGPSLLNLITNVIFDTALANRGASVADSTGFRIGVTYRGLDSPAYGQLGDSLKFLIFFGVSMFVYPAFATLYPTAERLRSVRALHYSNGMTPLSLWLGHLLYEIPSTGLVAALITIIYAVVIPGTVKAIGIFFIVLWLYGISSSVFAFVIALGAKSQLAAFAISAGVQAVMFLLYIVSYLLTLTYAPPIKTTSWIRYEHFTISALPIPITSITRAIMVGLNMFNLACIGQGGQFADSFGDILLYGGPILYLILQTLFLFGVLVWWDSGHRLPAIFRRQAKSGPMSPLGSEPIDTDVLVERQRVEGGSADDMLQARDLAKSYGSVVAVDGISFGVKSGEFFALLGPNSAGKTTTYSMIRGEVKPDRGDAYIGGHSIVLNRNAARANLGVCPQFDAIDALTVRQHLVYYARVKGLHRSRITANVDALIDAVSLRPFADRMAQKLSGGNQRKLSLAIAMIGSPAVLLIDEASSGMDIGAKRQIWRTLASFAPGRAVVLTTHSMEEADALASRVGIVSKRMLALGGINHLRRRFGDNYQLQIICGQENNNSREEDELTMRQSKGVVDFILRAIPGAVPGTERIYHGHLKFSIPVSSGMSVATLFDLLEDHRERLGILFYSVNRTSLEEVFLGVVRRHNVAEEGYNAIE